MEECQTDGSEPAYHFISVHLIDYPSNHLNDERTGSCNNWNCGAMEHGIVIRIKHLRTKSLQPNLHLAVNGVWKKE
jgi:hypothetical protein